MDGRAFQEEPGLDRPRRDNLLGARVEDGRLLDVALECVQHDRPERTLKVVQPAVVAGGADLSQGRVQSRHDTHGFLAVHEGYRPADPQRSV